MSTLIANVLNLIILLVFASVVAGTDFISAAGESVKINTHAIQNDESITITGGSHANFIFNWPHQKGKVCTATFSWNPSSQLLYVNTVTMCLQDYRTESGDALPLLNQDKLQCCVNGEPYHEPSKQSTEPGIPGNGQDSASTELRPSSAEEPSVTDEELLSDADIPELAPASEEMAAVPSEEFTPPLYSEPEQQGASDEYNLKRKRGAGFSGRRFRA